VDAVEVMLALDAVASTVHVSASRPGPRNDFLDQWRGREEELEADTEAIRMFIQSEGTGDMRVVPVWTSEAIDLISESHSAADIVRHIAADAEAALRKILDRT
jgi:nitronate monooxygenase